MEPLRAHDYLLRARGILLDRLRPLGDAAYRREFPIGLGSLARTLTHVMICEWFYIERLERREVPPYRKWPIQDEHPPSLELLEAAWNAQSVRTRAALERVADWGETIEYRSLSDDQDPATRPPPMIVSATADDLLTQLVLHEVHHRAQAMAMLRQLGAPVGDLDFNALMYRRRPADPA